LFTNNTIMWHYEYVLYILVICLNYFKVYYKLFLGNYITRLAGDFIISALKGLGR
jgi:hypothetical protein